MINLRYLLNFADACTDGGSFFGFPVWYEYLNCTPEGNPEISNINDFWLIGAAGLEMIMYLAGLAAVGLFIYGGFVFMTSQGSPERVATGRRTMLNATIGLVIAILAASLVSLVAGIFDSV